MNRILLKLLACPKCSSELECLDVARTDGPEILSADLRCFRCSRSYPVVNGIPRFVSADNYASSFGFQWNRFRSEQLDSLSGNSQSSNRFFSETQWTKDWLDGKWVLDAGSGAGRFLDVASVEGCEVVGVDISNAVDAARESLKRRANVHLVQASIFELPFRPASFDGVYSIGVIQHTPDPLRAVRALPPMLKEGGHIALSIYERRRFTMLNSKYLVRPLTKRIRDRHLLRVLKMVMPFVFPLTEVLYRIPILGKLFRFVIPVANYTNDPQLNMRQRYQWALMDTFDMLAPQFDDPQREEDVRRMLSETGVVDVKRLPNPGLNLVGIRSGNSITQEPAATLR